jgi:uncharacterized protein YgiM (DUF1202 family)
MDKQQLSRQLHRLAQEEIPDTMNLWPRLQGQLKRKSKPRSFSFAYALSAFVMISLVGIGGFIAFRGASVTTGEAVSPSQASDLNIVQTIGGVTMSLDWAYADAHLISVQYSVIYNPQEVTLPDFGMVSLRTADGLILPQDNNGGGGGGGGGDDTSVRFTNQVNFDASAIQGNPESLDLVLLVQYQESFQSFEFPATVPPPAEGLNGPKDISTATPLPFGGTVTGIVVSEEEVNLREGPSTIYSPIVTMTGGVPVQILMQTADSQWYNVRLADGTEGWISAAFVQIQPTATPMPFNGDPFALTATSIIGTATAMVQVTATPLPFNGDPFALTATQLINTATAEAQASILPPTVPPPNHVQVIEPSLIPPMQFTPTPVPANPANIFAFSFTVPFYPAKTGQVVATNYGSNTVTASVENVSITPAMTKFDFCYTLPNQDELWMPKIGLDTGFAASLGNMSSAATRGLDGQSLYPVYTTESRVVDNRACLPMFSYAPFSLEASEMDIQLDYIYSAAEPTDPATWAADEAFFKERGFDLSYAFVPIVVGAEQEFYNEPRPSNVLVYPLPESGALLITLRDYPDSFNEEWEATNYIYDHMLKNRIEGHWNFHVTVSD